MWRRRVWQRDTQSLSNLRVGRGRWRSGSRSFQGHSVDRGHRSARLDSFYRGQLSFPGGGVSTLWIKHLIIIIIIFRIIVIFFRTTRLSHLLLAARKIHSLPDNRGLSTHCLYYDTLISLVRVFLPALQRRCPSVCSSHTGIVPKRTKLSPWFLHRRSRAQKSFHSYLLARCNPRQLLSLLWIVHFRCRSGRRVTLAGTYSQC